MADTGEWTTRRYLSLLGSIAIWVIVAIDAWYLWPTQLGGSTSMVIVSGVSMEPTYFDGDLVIARKIEPTVGDVIVYAPEGLGGAQIVHRIIGGNATDGWQLEGDNNDFVDPFTPKGDEVKGVVLVHYSNFGRVTALLLNPIVWSLVLLAAIVLMVWYSGDTCEDDPRDDDHDGDTSATGDAPSDAASDGVATPDDAGGDPPPSDDPTEVPSEPQRSLAGAMASTMRIGAAVAVLVLALGLAPTPASASQLSVNTGGGVAAIKLERCSNQLLAATVAGPATGSNYRQVAISGIPAACAGFALDVKLHRANGNLMTSGSGTAAAGTVNVTTAAQYNASQVATVVVSIRGWLFFPAWTPPTNDPPVGECRGYLPATGAVVSGTSCALSSTQVGDVQDLDAYNGGPGKYRSVQMATAFTPDGYNGPSGWVNYQESTVWRYTLNLSAAPYSTGLNLTGDYYLYNNGNNVAIAAGEDCSNLASVTFQERVAGGNPSSTFILSERPIGWMDPSALLCHRP